METIHWDPKTLLGIDTEANGQLCQLYCVGKRCRLVIGESQRAKALQLIDNLSKKRLEDVNLSHLRSLAYKCLCVICRPHQNRLIWYTWAIAIAGAARHNIYLTASSASHTALISSLATQLDAKREMARKFEEQESVGQARLTSYQNSLEISNRKVKEQEKRIKLLETEKMALEEKMEKDPAASFEGCFRNRSFGGNAKGSDHLLLLKQAEIDILRDEKSTLATEVGELSEQNDALKSELEESRQESDKLRGSEAELTKMSKCQRLVAEQLERELSNRAEFEQEMKRLEDVLDSVESKMQEEFDILHEYQRLQLAANQELEQRLRSEQCERRTERLEYKSKLRRESESNSLLAEQLGHRGAVLQRLEAEMKEMESSWLYWICQRVGGIGISGRARQLDGSEEGSVDG